MSHSNILKLAAAACVAALLACGLLVFFRMVHVGLRYASADRYTAGSAELDGAVKHLDIHWIDGAVNVVYRAGDSVGISETAPRAIADDAALRWWLDGDTLRIQYAKSGFFSLRGLNKALTVALPEGMELGSVGIEATCGDVSVPDLRAEAADIALTSGDLALGQTGAAGDIRVSCTSGDIRAALDDVEALTIRGTSGNIDVSLGSAQAADITTTSGRVTLSGSRVEKGELGNTSGGISVDLAAFDDLRIRSTSGNVAAALPSDPGFTAEISTTSGKLDSAVALRREGGGYVCGDGGARLSIDTTSGDVRLAEAGGQ